MRHVLNRVMVAIMNACGVPAAVKDSARYAWRCLPGSTSADRDGERTRRPGFRSVVSPMR